jgi:hypothetical protein
MGRPIWGPAMDHGIPEPSEIADRGQRCTKNPERMDVLEETSGATEIQQQHNGPRPKTVSTSRKQGDFQ